MKTNGTRKNSRHYSKPGCGYDTFGMALGYYNYVSVEKAASFSVNIIGEGQKFLQGSSSNLVVRSAIAAFELAGQTVPNLAFACENNISVDAVIQKRKISDDKAEIVIITYKVRHADMMAALKAIGALDCTYEVSDYIRVEEDED